MGPFESQVETAVAERRNIRRRGVLREADDREPFEKLANAWLAFEPILNDKSKTSLQLWAEGGSAVVAAAKQLAFHVLRSRKAPAGFSRVVLPFTDFRQQDARTFFANHRDELYRLLAAKDFALAAGGIEVEGFSIHDTTGRGELDQIVKVVESSAAALKRSGLPKVRGLLYGSIYVTDRLRNRDSIAFYRSKQDTIWIRPRTRWGAASQHDFVHEIGHRYYQRFLTPMQRETWGRWDRALRRDRAAMPTRYAKKSKDAEEHFCEAFALRVHGRLQDAFLPMFREIVG